MPIVSADHFKPKTELVTLPSMEGTDNQVELRRAPIVDVLSKYSNLSELFAARVAQSEEDEQGEQDANPSPQQVKENLERSAKITPMLNELAVLSFVNPKLSHEETPPDGYASVHWLDYSDKVFILNWLNGNQQVNAARFRTPESPNADDAASNRKRVPDTTK